MGADVLCVGLHQQIGVDVIDGLEVCSPRDRISVEDRAEGLGLVQCDLCETHVGDVLFEGGFLPCEAHDHHAAGGQSARGLQAVIRRTT